MKLTASVKLLPPDGGAALLATLTAMNEAAQWCADEARESRVWGRTSLQRRCYAEAKARFGLGAQATIHALRKAANSYADKSRSGSRQAVAPHGAVAFDDRNLAWNIDAEDVRIWTTAGRQVVPFTCGPAQRKLLAFRKGESDLVLRDGCWYLYATCDVQVPEMPLATVEADFLGIDLGITNVVATSDGDLVAEIVGRDIPVAKIRARYAKTRGKLQSKKTKSANRLNRKRRGKEARFAADVNHCISKEVVRDAQRTGRAIAIEDLAGIRERVTVRRRQRRMHHSWAFAQLRSFIDYKSKLAGVPVFVVDPRNTSRTCPACDHVAKGNRHGEKFRWLDCGFVGHADKIAAWNIRRQAVGTLAVLRWLEIQSGGAVIRPYAGTDPGPLSADHGPLVCEGGLPGR
jgi:IS605 OrfB family transposase